MEGFDDLEQLLKDLGALGTKVGKEALNDGAEIVLKNQKKDAPRDTGSADNLKILDGKTHEAKIGIDYTNWDECKSLYYQDLGYTLWKNGKHYEPNVNWMEKSFERCKSQAEKAIVDKLSSEIDKIIG